MISKKTCSVACDLAPDKLVAAIRQGHRHIRPLSRGEWASIINLLPTKRAGRFDRCRYFQQSS
jgi:hypothetical protein